MRNLRLFSVVALVLCALIVASGCAKKKPEEAMPQTGDEAAERAQREAAEERTPRPVEVVDDFQTREPSAADEAEPTLAELNARGVLKTIYFGFDRNDLTPESQRILRENADWLKASPGYSVVIEGHCDERGSIEYNLALGERRASSVRDYLASLGIDRSRMRIVSFGEERPAAPGHDESAWSQNRRAAFVLER